MRDSPIEMTREAISRLAAGDTAGANWLINAAHDLTRWPETPDASDETRLAAGWVQQARCGDELPPKDVAGPSGWSPAPGAAGAWRYKGTTGSGVEIYTVWLRWLAPVDVPR